MGLPGIFQSVKPLKWSPLAALFFILVLLMECTLLGSFTGTYSPDRDQPVESCYSMGVGAPVQISTVGDATSIHVRWLVLFGNLLFAYVLAAILAHAAGRMTGFRRPARAFGGVAAIIIGIIFLASISFSRWYWGYWFSRPPVLREIHEVAEVTAVVPIMTQADEQGNRTIIPQSDYSLADQLEYARKDPYYGLDERLLLALNDRKLLPETVQTVMPDIPALFPLIQRTGILARPEDGYEDGDLLMGVLVMARTATGQRYMFVGAHGQQVSNDHRPYYEMLFAATGPSNTNDFVRGQRFFYDTAGIEGAEWYLMWPALSLFGIPLGFLAFTLLTGLYRAVKRVRESRAGG